jgi:hypothetical protein
MPNNITKRELFIKSLINELSPKEKKQLNNWKPANFIFRDGEDFKKDFSLYMQIKLDSVLLRNEFIKKHFPDENTPT